ncbi:hypothetical protein HPB50_013384 [Hyalomma asiaticum]|uniref:Uncharacterized protein n=1 Tax=Hyalomma asiaticum TaxID=266040 RepID=A0ACB7SND3_HYAAI|nr:hypothetical protein HPB50_013384 [Hyalomma asiaticum]
MYPLCETISTRCSVSTDQECVVGVAIQRDADQTTPSETGPEKAATVAKMAQMGAEPRTTVGIQRSESAFGKSPTSVPQRSSQSAMEDENFDEAVIESSSKGASGTADSRMAVGSVDVAVTSSSVAPTTASASGNTAASSKAAKTITSVGSRDVFKETAAVLLLRPGRWLCS